LLADKISRIEYAKKKEKKAKITFQKDEAIPRDDVYKSHTVRVPSGEPASSLSRPVPKRKPGTVRPIGKGKLLKKGGPSSVCVLSGIIYIN
jgi:myosin-1